ARGAASNAAPDVASSPADAGAALNAQSGVAGEPSRAPSGGRPGTAAKEKFSRDPSERTATEESSEGPRGKAATAESSRSGPEPSPSVEFGSVLVSDSVSLLDSV